VAPNRTVHVSLAEYPRHLAGDNRILDVLGDLEGAGRTLGRVGDVLVLGMRLGVEPRGPNNCFSELKALSVPLVCTLVRSPYCDDIPRPGDFQFQVRIIRHGHKLRICWPPEDRMVRPREPHHFGGESFYVEVPHAPECDGKVDLPEGERLDSRYDPMEWRRRRPQRGPRDVHLVKC
jgi:hypothetical protein